MTYHAYELIDTSTAALAVDVSDRTVRRWVRAGLLANYGDDRHIRLALPELATLTDARRGRPGG